MQTWIAVLAVSLMAAWTAPAAARRRRRLTVRTGVYAAARSELAHWVEIAPASGARRAEARTQGVGAARPRRLDQRRGRGARHPGPTTRPSTPTSPAPQRPHPRAPRPARRLTRRRSSAIWAKLELLAGATWRSVERGVTEPRPPLGDPGLWPPPARRKRAPARWRPTLSRWTIRRRGECRCACARFASRAAAALRSRVVLHA
jgi:hypothetical protein